MRITRKDKKKLRAIMLCYTGNPECRKSKYSKHKWILIKRDFIVWFNLFSSNRESKIANTVKRKTN
jgi:hypothetical protein